MNQIGFEKSAQGNEFVQGFDPAARQFLPEKYAVATPDEAHRAMQKAAAAAPIFGKMSGAARAKFLRAIAEEIENRGEAIARRAIVETALPEARVLGERARTCFQLRHFAQVLEEGSWLEAAIDTAQPARQPLPKPDLRRMLVPTGPTVVFAPANFPLAYSTAGTDVASALAAGCPVVVKAHEGHPGTHALVAEAVVAAAEKTGMPDGVFSSLFGKGYALGRLLVEHPLTKNVAFTGSLVGGRALFDLAAARPEPIPVFAEMSSVNPVFILPERMAAAPDALAATLAASVNLHAGQYCTCPGLLVVLENSDTPVFVEKLKTAFAQQPAQTMLSQNIFQNFEKRKGETTAEKGVSIEFEFEKKEGKLCSTPTLASVAAKDFLKNPTLQDEVFGQFSMLVRCRNRAEMLAVAANFAGQLTATVWSSGDRETARWQPLFDLLENRVGRLIFNSVPTGLEVAAATVHGGPFPATTDGRFTSVGAAAMRRFLRPVCFQNFTQKMLPAALRDSNPLKIWRLVDGEWTRKKLRKI